MRKHALKQSRARARARYRNRPFECDYEHRFAEHEHETTFDIFNELATQDTSDARARWDGRSRSICHPMAQLRMLVKHTVECMRGRVNCRHHGRPESDHSLQFHCMRRLAATISSL
jgi:hypothetical protein